MKKVSQQFLCLFVVAILHLKNGCLLPQRWQQFLRSLTSLKNNKSGNESGNIGATLFHKVMKSVPHLLALEMTDDTLKELRHFLL
jgi:hypothetical protein